MVIAVRTYASSP